MTDNERTDDEREADRLIKESGPLQERRRIREAAIEMHRRIRHGETPEPVTVGDTTISYDPTRAYGWRGIVIRDFLGREHGFEEWLSGSRDD